MHCIISSEACILWSCVIAEIFFYRTVNGMLENPVTKTSIMSWIRLPVKLTLELLMKVFSLILHVCKA